MVVTAMPQKKKTAAKNKGCDLQSRFWGTELASYLYPVVSSQKRGGHSGCIGIHSKDDAPINSGTASV